VRLPFLAAPERRPAEISPQAGDALPQLRVLVVDDHRDTADSLAWVLHSLGHEARAAYDGPSALKAVEEQAPDVIIQDLELPHMCGYEVARRIRERSAAKDAVLVAITGSPRVHAPVEDDATFDLFLMKPVGLSALQTVLRSASARRAEKAQPPTSTAAR
jgi:CheY-like chemotaxis protein